MLDFLGNFSAIAITVITVAGFLAIAAFVVFEIWTMLYFWIKHSLSDSTGERAVPVSTRRSRIRG